MDSLIIVGLLRDKFGVMRIHPVNEQAKRLARFAKVKSFSPAMLRVAAEMGFVIKREIFAGSLTTDPALSTAETIKLLKGLTS